MKQRTKKISSLKTITSKKLKKRIEEAKNAVKMLTIKIYRESEQLGLNQHEQFGRLLIYH
jgi:hypothetical protein